MPETKRPVLYVIVCAAPPAKYIAEFIVRAQQAGWDTCVIATPQATSFIDIAHLTQLTKHIVRTDYKSPGESDIFPKADAIVAIPATFNTINKAATGISDTLAAGILCEAMGRGTPPIVAVPCLKMDLARHPAFPRSLEILRGCGVHILHEPARYPSPLVVPWDDVLNTLQKLYLEGRSINDTKLLL